MAYKLGLKATKGRTLNVTILFRKQTKISNHTISKNIFFSYNVLKKDEETYKKRDRQIHQRRNIFRRSTCQDKIFF